MNDNRRCPRAFLATVLGIDPGTIRDDARPGIQEGWDSLAHMRLVLEIEAACGRRLASADILDLTSLTGIERVLARACGR